MTDPSSSSACPPSKHTVFDNLSKPRSPNTHFLLTFDEHVIKTYGRSIFCNYLWSCSAPLPCLPGLRPPVSKQTATPIKLPIYRHSAALLLWHHMYCIVSCSRILHVMLLYPYILVMFVSQRQKRAKPITRSTVVTLKMVLTLAWNRLLEIVRPPALPSRTSQTFLILWQFDLLNFFDFCPPSGSHHFYLVSWPESTSYPWPDLVRDAAATTSYRTQQKLMPQGEASLPLGENRSVPDQWVNHQRICAPEVFGFQCHKLLHWNPKCSKDPSKMQVHISLSRWHVHSKSFCKPCFKTVRRQAQHLTLTHIHREKSHKHRHTE